MSAHIMRGTNISERIPVQCGTKQGGLTSPFTTIPRWYINGVSLDIEDKLTYFGSILGENGDKNTVKTIVEQHIVTFWAPGGRN